MSMDNTPQGGDYKTEYLGSWIGVDFDGTLATYGGWEGPEVLGNPIPCMVERVTKWVANGEDVRIVTARVSPVTPRGSETNPILSRRAIQEWCLKHLGCELEITHEKDYLMRELWDDRAVQVRPGTGVPVEDELRIEIAQLRDTISKSSKLIIGYNQLRDIHKRSVALGTAARKAKLTLEWMRTS